MLLLSHNIFIGMVIQFFSVLWYETFQGLPSSSQTPGREHSCNILKKPNPNYLTRMILCLTWGLIKLSELNRRWISRSVSLPSQIFFSLHCAQRCCSERSLPINQSLVKLMEPSKASWVSLDPAPKSFKFTLMSPEVSQHVKVGTGRVSLGYLSQNVSTPLFRTLDPDYEADVLRL